MTSRRISVAGGIFAASLLVLPAFGSNLFPLPEYNTFRVSANNAGYAAVGEYVYYTSVGSGLVITASKSKPSVVRIHIAEQEDWRGQFTLIPALEAYLSQRPELVRGADAQVACLDSFEHHSAFDKVIPSSKSYSMVFDLSAQESRDQLKSLLTNIAPGIMLAQCALDNVLHTLKLQ